MPQYILVVKNKVRKPIEIADFKNAISTLTNSNPQVSVMEVYPALEGADIIARVEAPNDNAVLPIFDPNPSVNIRILEAKSLGGKPFTQKDAASYADVGQTNVNNLEITIKTGSDDCRGDSVVVACVVFGQNQSFCTEVHPQNGPWANGTTNGPFNLTCGPPFGPLDSLRQFYIQFTSNPTWPETGDNWNMESILVTYALSSGVTGFLVVQSGDPLMRFKTAGTWYATISLPSS